MNNVRSVSGTNLVAVTFLSLHLGVHVGLHLSQQTVIEGLGPAGNNQGEMND